MRVDYTVSPITASEWERYRGHKSEEVCVVAITQLIRHVQQGSHSYLCIEIDH